MEGNYSVRIEHFAEGHFIKSFRKKYHAAWEVTWRAIDAQLARIDALLETEKADHIVGDDAIKIIKTQFKIAGTQESTKSSGNRCIVAWHTDERYVVVLLVYGKTDLSGKHETAEWQGIVKKNYPQYRRLFNGC